MLIETLKYFIFSLYVKLKAQKYIFTLLAMRSPTCRNRRLSTLAKVTNTIEIDCYL